MFNSQYYQKELSIIFKKCYIHNILKTLKKSGPFIMREHFNNVLIILLNFHQNIEVT